MNLSLNGNWTLYYTPEKGGKAALFSRASLADWEKIPAVVPGNVELDLVRAGREEDPFYGENLYRFAKYEYHQWVFAKELVVPQDFPAGNAALRFEGIDTIADIYVDDSHVGHSENMFIAQEFDVTGLVTPGSRHMVYVHIHSAMNFARSKTYTVAMRGTAHRNEICYLRKAPHCFGWDIMPRLLSAGIWRNVSLTSFSDTRILETYYATPKLERGGIHLQYAYRFTTNADTLEGFVVEVEGFCGDSHFFHSLPAHFISGNHNTFIPHPRLWWPVGYGEHPLYEVHMRLKHFGKIVDERVEHIGLRTLRLERSFQRPHQQFQFFVNETPIFVKGTNWVPLDAMHSRDAQRLERAFALCVDSGVNMIRCWGGNVYEDTPFFNLCDQNGILVWQDCAMGNTNYPQTADFVPVMEEELGAVIRKLRNHPSLAIWSSDNEVDLKNMGFLYPTYDSRINRVSHDTMRRLMQAHDPYRFYLCSSPEIPEGFHTDDVPEQHTWGPRAWFKDDFYKHSSAHFIGEAGYHGCPAPSSIRMFLPPEKQWPMENTAWAAHSTEDIRIEPVLNSRNHLMADQVRLMFNQEPGDDLEHFALLSQIVQAEAMKFFMERTRALKWRRTGIIWWNMIDGWPQISDSVVDYYFRKKLAYHYLKRSMRPVLLFLGEVNGWSQPLIASNDTLRDANIAYTLTDGDTGEILHQGEEILAANENATIAEIPCVGSRQRLYVLRWTLDGVEYGNHYVTGMPPYDPETMLRWLKIIQKLPEPFEPEL